ncbi:MAG: hypothetical protein GC154_05950 [bacterium]|nr:hypothetical protein [bacterium]
MNAATDLKPCLETLARILIRCFVMGFVLMVIWFAVVFCAEDFVFNIHASLFGIEKAQFIAINYYGLAAVKMFVILVFLIPYIAIRLVMMKGLPEGKN